MRLRTEYSMTKYACGSVPLPRRLFLFPGFLPKKPLMLYNYINPLLWKNPFLICHFNRNEVKWRNLPAAAAIMHYE